MFIGVETFSSCIWTCNLDNFIQTFGHFTFIWCFHSTATHLPYNTHITQVTGVLITVLFGDFPLSLKGLKGCSKAQLQIPHLLSAEKYNKTLIISWHACSLGGFPGKKDGGAHRNFWKESLRGTKILLCGRGMKCFTSKTKHYLFINLSLLTINSIALILAVCRTPIIYELS